MNFVEPIFYTPIYKDGVPQIRTETLLFHVPRIKSWGSGMILQTSTTTILIDLAYQGAAYSGTDKLVSYLQSLGIDHLDLVIITHPHGDHIAADQDGLLKFTANFTIDKIWCNGAPVPLWYDGESDCPDGETSIVGYQQILDQIFPTGYTVQAQGTVPTILGDSVIPYEEPRQGEEYLIGDIAIKVLHPPDSHTTRFQNAACMVLQVAYKGKKIMITADGLEETETNILSAYSAEDLQSDILYLGHHGMDDATGESWYTAIAPSLLTVQCAEGDEVSARIKAMIGNKTIYNPYYYDDIVFVVTLGIVKYADRFEYVFLSPVF